jgi:hypothetical protein
MTTPLNSAKKRKLADSEPGMITHQTSPSHKTVQNSKDNPADNDALNEYLAKKKKPQPKPRKLQRHVIANKASSSSSLEPSSSQGSSISSVVKSDSAQSKSATDNFEKMFNRAQSFKYKIHTISGPFDIHFV